MHPYLRLIVAHLIRFKIELVVLDASVKIYATPSVMPGFRVFGELPIPPQRDLVVKIWVMNIGK